MNTDRSSAQRTTSATNGARSHGPVTAEGKAVSSLNHVRHGLAAKMLLLPSENAGEYEQNLDEWASTLKPTSPAEVQLVVAAADLAWRLQRLALIERRQMAAHLEELLQATEAGRAFVLAQTVAQGVAQLAALAASQKTRRRGEDVLQLLPAINRVLDCVGAVNLSLAPVQLLVDAVEALRAAAVVGDVHEEFEALATSSRAVEHVLALRLSALNIVVERERERLADEIVLGDEHQMKLLERRRAALQRDLDKTLDLFAKTKKLAIESGSFDTAAQPISVELRVIGGGRK